MNNKVKFLRGTSDEYAAAEKDNDTIYFTTDDGKLYIGDKEISGTGGLTIDDTLSDTSTNPVQNKVIKAAIDEKADKTTATTDTDGLMSASDKTKLDNADDAYALKSKYGDTTIDVGRKAGTGVGDHSTAEGYYTTASGHSSHAEGSNTIASGKRSHAECDSTTASGNYSHAEGFSTIASGSDAHAEGSCTIASGNYSHARGNHTKALHENETASGKYNVSNSDTLFSIGDGTADDARHNAFEITTTGGKLHDKDIATTDLIPTELPANGGNADTVNGRHCGRIATLMQDGNYWDASAENINDAYLQWDGSKFFRFKTYGGNLIHTDNADTLDGLHADDFVKSFGQQFDLPSNVDVPTWILQNANYYTRYRTHAGIAGLTNVPNNSTDYVWYWFDGVNIIAREFATGKYYICDMINGSFSGWKDVYTSGFKPYVTGSVTVTTTDTTITTNHNFTPSAVLWWRSSGMSNTYYEIYSATGFTNSTITINYQEFSSTGGTNWVLNYIIFR